MSSTERRTLRESFRTFEPLFFGSRPRLAALAIMSFLAGVSEAMMLVVVVRLGLEIAGSKQAASLGFGPVTSLKITVAQLFVVAFVLATARVVLQVGSAWVAARMTADIVARTRRESFRDFIRASWSAQAAQDGGVVQDLLLRHVTRTSSAVGVIALGLTVSFNFIALVLSAVVVDPVAAALIIVTALGLFALLRPLSKLNKQFSAAQSKAGTDFAKTVLESIALTQEIRTFNVTQPASKRVDVASYAEIRPFFRSKFVGAILSPLYQLAAIMILLVGLLAVYTLVDRPLASLGAIVVILVRALNYSNSMQNTYHSLLEAAPFAERLLDERAAWVASMPQSGRELLPEIRQLDFSSVSYRYVPERLALDDVSFSVAAGETVGIVGPSGSGKSTLVQLLLRLREPTDGLYLINGVDARTIDPDSWYRRVSFVPQDSNMWGGTVSDNIRFFRDHVTDEDVERAARMAHLHDDIVSWPDGYDTLLGPRGNAISGGQRQRVSLARALAVRPDVLILDEPTSALDMHSEKLVHETLTTLKGQVTMFIIAHRLSTLNTCDRIMVFGDGHLQAFGPRAELEAASPFYREALELSKLR